MGVLTMKRGYVIPIAFAIILGGILMWVFWPWRSRNFAKPEGIIVFLEWPDTSSHYKATSLCLQTDHKTTLETSETREVIKFAKLLRKDPSGKDVLFSVDGRIMNLGTEFLKYEIYKHLYDSSANHNPLYSMRIADFDTWNDGLVIADSRGEYKHPGTKIFIVDRNEKRCVKTKHKMHRSSVVVSVNSSGSHLVFRNHDGQVILYDIASNDERVLFVGNTPIISPDGKKIIYVDGNKNTQLYDMQTGQSSKLNIVICPRTRPVWSPDGRFIAFFSSADDKFLKAKVSIYSLADKQVVKRFEFKSLVFQIAWIEEVDKE